MEPLKPITIMGANASGKTDLALAIARKIGGEIISADSKQIYTKLSAGTAKPLGERKVNCCSQTLYHVEGIPYHFLDFTDPIQTYDVGTYVKDAKRVMEEIWQRGHVPIICGGTGMYIQSFWNGLDELPPANKEIRDELNILATSKGREALHAALAVIDPVTAQKIPHGNIQRVIRAIEISRLAGKPASQVWTGKFYNILPVHKGIFCFIKWKKEILQERIKARTLNNFSAWEKETRDLLDEGYPQDCPGLKTLGYPQMLDYIRGYFTKQETIQQIISVSMSYAKRQNTWFGRYKNISNIFFEKPEDYNLDNLAEKIINL